MNEVEVTVTVATDEDDLERARENAKATVSSKLGMANTDQSIEDGKIYEITGLRSKTDGQ